MRTHTHRNCFIRFLGDPLCKTGEQTTPHSVLKLFIDVFSCNRTSSLFYTNDLKVLIDIIVRQLADLSPGDKVRVVAFLMVGLRLRDKGRK